MRAQRAGRLRPLRAARRAAPPRRRRPSLTSYQLRHLPDPARDLGRQHREVLLVALKVGGHAGGAGGGRGPTALRGDTTAISCDGSAQPLRTQALPRSATCKSVPLASGRRSTGSGEIIRLLLDALTGRAPLSATPCWSSLRDCNCSA